MMDQTLFKSEERAVYALRSLYKKYGYLPFKMGKFEEYDLYLRNKDFLVSDRIITFTDTNGKLMALKPDVTLSIIRHFEEQAGCKQKVYYNENVYRLSGSTHQYKEIMQAGLECMGDIDIYDIYESVYLAGRSLQLIQSDFVVDVSHLGLLSALLDRAGADEYVRREISRCVAEKNAHDLKRICEENGVAEEICEKLTRFVGVYGERKQVLAQLGEMFEENEPALEQLRRLDALLDKTDFGSRVQFDFSIIHDMNYYNGIVFKGFLNGIAEGVLSGGQYDKLMARMGKKAGAVGFALYLDLLENLAPRKNAMDVDVLLLYDGATDMDEMVKMTRELTEAGKSVSAQKAVPEKLRYGEMVDMRKEGRE